MRMNRDVNRETLFRSLSFLNHTTSAIVRLASMAFLFCLLATGTSALAQTQEPLPQRVSRRQQMSMAELMRLADTVVYGKVVDTKSDWNSRRTLIYTTITIAVDTTVKGKATATLSFQQLGGQVGKLKTTVSHFPDFAVGEEVLLFLSLTKANKVSPLVNGGGGKYLIRRDDKTQAQYLNDDSVKMPIFSAKTRRSIAPEQLQASGRVALDDLLYSLQRVRSTGRISRQRGGE